MGGLFTQEDECRVFPAGEYRLLVSRDEVYERANAFFNKYRQEIVHADIATEQGKELFAVMLNNYMQNACHPNFRERTFFEKVGHWLKGRYSFSTRPTPSMLVEILESEGIMRIEQFGELLETLYEEERISAHDRDEYFFLVEQRRVPMMLLESAKNLANAMSPVKDETRPKHKRKILAFRQRRF